jgi:hypothetical protein
MAIHVISLTQNGDYFAMFSGSHKNDRITCQVTKNSVFDGAKLLETRAYLLQDDNDTFNYACKYIDGNRTQIEIKDTDQQITRDVANKSLIYIYTLVDATANTNIEIATDDIFKTNIAQNLIQTIL